MDTAEGLRRAPEVRALHVAADGALLVNACLPSDQQKSWMAYVVLANNVPLPPILGAVALIGGVVLLVAGKKE